MIRAIVSGLFLLFVSTLAWNQETNKLAEPEYSSVFFFLGGSADLQPLERQLPRKYTKAHALGYGGVSAGLVIASEKSPVRFKKTDRLQFVVRIDRDVDPVDLVQFFRFEVEKGQRILVMARVGAYSPTNKADLDAVTVKFIATKYGIPSPNGMLLQAWAEKTVSG